MPEWVFGPDVGLPDAGWMDEAEYQSKLNPPTQILPTVESSQEVRAAVAPTSQNGFPANNRSLIVTMTAGGVQFPVRKGACGELLMWAAERWHHEVEPLVPGTCWGYAERAIRGSSETSNHASGTAIDLNAPQHPLGTSPTATLSPTQIAAINRIIADADGALRWGGTYQGRKDPMHIEVNAPEGHVAGVLAQVTGGVDVAPETARQVDEIHEQITGVVAAWGGGVTDDKGTPYNALQLALRNNVEVHQVGLMVQQLLKRTQPKPAQLPQEDVNRIVAGVHAKAEATAAAMVDDVDEIVSVPFWKASLERCIKTMVQTFLVLAVPSSGLFNAFSMDWKMTGGLALSAGLLSILTSLGSAPIGEPDSPSLLKGAQ
jgi:hypothetical protein